MYIVFKEHKGNLSLKIKIKINKIAKFQTRVTPPCYTLAI